MWDGRTSLSWYSWVTGMGDKERGEEKAGSDEEVEMKMMKMMKLMRYFVTDMFVKRSAYSS